MTIKKWDIPWDAPAALIDWASLEADEIAVTAQIINLIYSQNRRIKNDPESIKTYVKKMSRAKCEKVIHRLIHKRVIFEENGELFHKKCEEILEKRKESHNKFSLFGKAGAETRARNQQIQRDLLSPPKDGLQPDSTSSTSDSSLLNTSLPSVTGRGSFSIFEAMTEEGEREARRVARGWDIRYLCGIFDGKVKSGEFKAPTKPDSAFPAWCAVYTKGKPPR